jgi:hypothetical protein
LIFQMCGGNTGRVARRSSWMNATSTAPAKVSTNRLDTNVTSLVISR